MCAGCSNPGRWLHQCTAYLLPKNDLPGRPYRHRDPKPYTLPLPAVSMGGDAGDSKDIADNG